MTEINPDEILKPFRDQIDQIDRELIALIARRFDIVRQVGETKAKHDLSPYQPARMQVVLDRASGLAEDYDLDPEVICKLYEVMIDYAHSLEFKIAGVKDNV